MGKSGPCFWQTFENGDEIMREIYLDNSATTAVSPEAAALALHIMTEEYGNPSSLHRRGFLAERAMTEARGQVAAVLHCRPEEIIFTAGGTESNNIALLGAARAMKRRGNRIVTTAVEHHAVLNCCQQLEQEGWEVTTILPDQNGDISAEAVLSAVRPDTALVSVMMVNNELGSIYPIADIAKGLKAVNEKTLLHTDAVQGFLKVPFSAKALGADFIAISGHKVGAPKGIGALYIGPRVRNPRPLLPGGGQEMGLRSGTEATAQIAGFAKAVELRWDHLEDKLHHMAEVKAYAVEKLTAIPDLQIIGSGKAPHVLSVSMAGWPSQNVVNDLGSQGICVSAGSACHHGKSSQVVSALGLPKRVAAGVIRLSFGPETTFAEIDACAEALRNHHDHRMPML